MTSSKYYLKNRESILKRHSVRNKKLWKKFKKEGKTQLMSNSRDKTREKIRERDGHICQNCKKQWVSGRKFDVHHKDCKKEKTKQCDNYEKEKDNLITLCHKCHLNLPEHRKAMREAVHKNKITPK